MQSYQRLNLYLCETWLKNGNLYNQPPAMSVTKNDIGTQNTWYRYNLKCT